MYYKLKSIVVFLKFISNIFKYIKHPIILLYEENRDNNPLIILIFIDILAIPCSKQQKLSRFYAQA